MKPVFNRSLKSNYSWLPISKTNSIININAKGRWSVVVALWSDGEFLIQIFNSTVTSDLFREFIWVLTFALKYKSKNHLQNIVLTMDNASIHTSDKTRKLLSLFEYNVKYLPPYSPKLAPVELFFNIMKQKIRSFWSMRVINFDNKSGYEWILESVQSVNSSKVKSLWICSVKQAKQCIASTDEND